MLINIRILFVWRKWLVLFGFCCYYCCYTKHAPPISLLLIIIIIIINTNIIDVIFDIVFAILINCHNNNYNFYPGCHSLENFGVSFCNWPWTALRRSSLCSIHIFQVAYKKIHTIVKRSYNTF